MVITSRMCYSLAMLVTVLGNCPAADEPLSRVVIGKIGKAATALVELKPRREYGSAFCIHPSGLFLTNEHVIHPPSQYPGQQQTAVGEVTLVLNPGDKQAEKSYPARVIRTDKGLDLALLRIEGAKDLPALTLGSDENLEELMDVVAFGFPFGTGLSPGPGGFPLGRPAAQDQHDYPSISVNAGSITALRRKDGTLDRIQLDATINPGNSGGPVLDKNGKVIGVVVSQVLAQRLGRTGIGYAIPVNHITRFVARPDIQFDMPALSPANVYKPVLFEARIVPIVPSQAPLTVDLILKPAGGREQSHRMEPAEGKYRVTTVPLPAPPGPLRVRLVAQFANGLLNATAADQSFTVGNRELKLSEIRAVHLKPQPRTVLGDGKEVEGPVSGLNAVPVQLGEQLVALDLSKAAQVRFAAAIETDQLWYTLLIRQGDKEILRQTDCVIVEGSLPTPTVAAGETGIRPPTLEGNSAVRKLAAPIADVVVGGAGRYLVLHLPSLHRLAVFDVSAAEVVGNIPIKEDNARFAAGLEDVVVLLPGSGSMERWSLRTFERDVVTTLPIKGIIKGVAMGSASKGPLLVHSATGTQDLDHASFDLVDVERMRLLQGAIKAQGMMGGSYRDIVHLRASANGKVFGMWCTSHSPSGVGVIVASDGGVQSYYAHWSAGHVLPGPDGKLLFTRSGTCSPQVNLNDMQGHPQGGPVLPACQGDYYLSLPPVGNRGQARPRPPAHGVPQSTQQPAANGGPVTIRVLGKDKPIAGVPELDLPAPGEEWVKHDFTFDKRVHLIPEARLIITIPATNDRLVLYRFGS